MDQVVSARPEAGLIQLTVISPWCGGPGFDAPGIDETVEYLQFDNRLNHSTPCELYQRGYENGRYRIMVYAHDDVIVHDSQWKARIVSLFVDHPRAVAVGFCGAEGLGNWDLYRKPYRLENMARRRVYSNLTDAETHGARLAGNRQVAVLDAFLMAVDREFLLRCGGWPHHHLTHHCLDTWLAVEAARRGAEIWMAGVSATHLGGRSSAGKRYAEADWLQGGTLDQDHRAPHRWIWDEYRDVLPIEVDP